MKYWHVKLKGEPSKDEIQSVVGSMSGKVVRRYVEGDETHVFVATEESGSTSATIAVREDAVIKEVSPATAHSGGSPRPRMDK